MNNELQHHGVKGMKWGVRHDKPMSKRQAGKVINNKRLSDKEKAKILKAREKAIVSEGQKKISNAEAKFLSNKTRGTAKRYAKTVAKNTKKVAKDRYITPETRLKAIKTLSDLSNVSPKYTREVYRLMNLFQADYGGTAYDIRG